ncbi:hypothetical protein [Actinoplanes sp. URMC 104]|uniref:hypothetical protein n=1 Tax=Actinoplanes sp. URMC 104 TaxID=3423409 RepID=UPI003F1A28D1
MEPVPVTRRVRRTVRMAVALVVGQAMLCALIGWLTFGRSRSEPAGPPGSSVVDQLAAPPVVPSVPPAVHGTAVPTGQARELVSPASRRAVRKGARTPVPAPATSPVSLPEPISAPPGDEPGTVAPAPPPATTTSAPAPVPPAPATTDPATADPTSPAATSAPATTPATTAPAATPAPSRPVERVQEPVRIGDECRPLGAYGRTASGQLVRCERDRRHEPRWKIV